MTASVAAAALSWRSSSHMRISQDRHAELTERQTRLPRRHGHEAVSGHARRRVHFQERVAPVRAQDEVEPAPSGAADDVERSERLRADALFEAGIDVARTEIFR